MPGSTIKPDVAPTPPPSKTSRASAPPETNGSPPPAPAPAASTPPADSFAASEALPIACPTCFSAPTNPLDAALQPSIIRQAHNAPVFKAINESAVLEALSYLEPQIRSGAFDLNEPVSGGRYSGYPPIAAAARECNLNLVAVLLKHRSVNPCARDNRTRDAFRHRTVLMHALSGALEHKNTACLRLLLADPRVLASINDTCMSSTEPSLRWSVLNMALRANSDGRSFAPIVVALLIEAGAKPVFASPAPSSFSASTKHDL